MKQLPSRLRRLDGALADLPLEEPMLLSELDGFLTGILLCPEEISSAEWMRTVWGEGDIPPFDDPLDVQWFADAVLAHQAGIVRDLARGKLQPLFDIDERNGDVMWEPWIDGFVEAMALRPDAWAALADTDALSRLSTLIAVARNESDLDSVEINAMQEQAPSDLIDAILALHGTTSAPPPAAARPVKVGRNDPCPCGSGRKSKRCCA